MSILLAGGAGYIGSHTAVELIKAGYDVVIVDNYDNSCPEVINRIERITGTRPTTYEADVRDIEAMMQVFSENEIDVVIHFAGLKAVGESVKKPVMYYRNNIDTTLTLLEVMEEYGCNNMVFSSSATVYGEDAPVPYIESMGRGKCTNPYGWTKNMMEQILTDAANARKEMSVVILRYFNPIGADASGLIGEDPQGIHAYTRWVNIELNINETKYPHIQFQDGIAINPYKECELLYLPVDIIHELPIASDWNDINRVISENEAIRAEVNEAIGLEWKKMATSQKKRYLKEHMG